MEKTKEELLNGKDLIFYHSKEDNDTVEGNKKEIMEVMDEYSKQQAIEFMKFNAKEISSYLNYLKKVNESVTDEELMKALTTFENSNLSARYNLFIEQSTKS